MATPMEEKIDDGLEDGECSDSDDGTPSNPVKEGYRLACNTSNTPTGTSYRHRSQIPQIVINSDESSNDSDEDGPSLYKKSKNPYMFQKETQHKPFVNPNLVNNSNNGCFQRQATKRRNNIWSSVISEQVLSHDVKSFGVNSSTIRFDERDVESYDFTKAKEDERPALELDPADEDPNKDDLFGGVVDLEKEVRKHENRKRKRNVKERLGKRSFDTHKLRKLGVTENDEPSEVVKAIAYGLGEPKLDLVTRIVDNIGTSEAIRLYYMTEDIEDAGGMMVKNGTRRRTPGGVFIELLKSDGKVSPEVISAIFEEEDKEWRRQLKEKRKVKKATRKKWKKKNRPGRQMDLDRPESPSQAEEDLEVLKVLGTSTELETSDFPERPATPEPKDDSSDGQGKEEEEEGEEEEDEDEEEGDDISVAIAKAKAAIMKKQRELAKKSGACEESEMVDDDKLAGSAYAADCGGDMAIG